MSDIFLDIAGCKYSFYFLQCLKLYVQPSSPSTNIMSHQALRAPKALNKSNLLSLSFITENLLSAHPLLTHTLLTFLSETTWRRSPAENTSQAVVPDEGNHQACFIWRLPRDSNVTADYRMEPIRLEEFQ